MFKINDIVTFIGDPRCEEYKVMDISDEPYEIFDDGSKHYVLSLCKVNGDYNDWRYVNDAQIELKKWYTIIGTKAEMFVDGEWKYGKIVDGYRFNDGIVTIEADDGKKYWCGVCRTDCYRRSLLKREDNEK